jgi:hypothetical protein
MNNRLTVAALAGVLLATCPAKAQEQLAVQATIPYVPLVSFSVGSRGNVFGHTTDRVTYLIFPLPVSSILPRAACGKFRSGPSQTPSPTASLRPPKTPSPPLG